MLNHLKLATAILAALTFVSLWSCAGGNLQSSRLYGSLELNDEMGMEGYEDVQGSFFVDQLSNAIHLDVEGFPVDFTEDYELVLVMTDESIYQAPLPIDEWGSSSIEISVLDTADVAEIHVVFNENEVVTLDTLRAARKRRVREEKKGCESDQWNNDSPMRNEEKERKKGKSGKVDNERVNGCGRGSEKNRVDETEGETEDEGDEEGSDEEIADNGREGDVQVQEEEDFNETNDPLAGFDEEDLLFIEGTDVDNEGIDVVADHEEDAEVDEEEQGKVVIILSSLF